MKAVVCIKRVVDANVKVRANANETEVDIAGSKMSVNPFDENALEAAVNLKEQGIVNEIIAITVGDDKSVDVLRQGIARGCTRAILLKTNKWLEPIHVAKILAAIIKQEQPHLIILGKKAIDDEASQVPGMLSGILRYPSAHGVSNLTVNSNNLQVSAELDDGVELLELRLPAIISVDLSLNEPRFIKLPQLMLAKKHPVETIEVDSLGLDLKPSSRIKKVTNISLTKQCKFVDNIDDIIDVLKQTKVI